MFLIVLIQVNRYSKPEEKSLPNLCVCNLGRNLCNALHNNAIKVHSAAVYKDKVMV